MFLQWDPEARGEEGLYNQTTQTPYLRWGMLWCVNCALYMLAPPHHTLQEKKSTDVTYLNCVTVYVFRANSLLSLYYRTCGGIPGAAVAGERSISVREERV